MAGRTNGKKNQITKKHIDRYLYTFAMEIGCDLPNDEMLKNIFFLLLGSEENVTFNCSIEEEHFVILINVCLNLFEEAKKTAIGGIFERIIMGLKQALYYSRLQ